MTYHQSTVVRYQAMTSDQKEQAVAAHVEALVSLGWRWEGRGLIPTYQAEALHGPDSPRSGALSEKLLTSITRNN
tara:strand:- start:3317 stop:3541 length:225 start_codon:yes stop_codon:yes gene_type:complete